VAKTNGFVDCCQVDRRGAPGVLVTITTRCMTRQVPYKKLDDRPRFKDKPLARRWHGQTPRADQWSSHGTAIGNPNEEAKLP
jgi:hypothetical protein